MRVFLAFSAALFALTAHAQMELAVDNDGDTLTLRVAGQWANSCTPVLDQALLEDGDIVLLARRDRGNHCRQVTSPYAFELSVSELINDAPVAGDYPVRLYVRDGQSRAATLAGFDILQLGERPQTRPESGLWWAQQGGKFETAGPGVGFAIEVQGDQSVVMLNGYAPSGQANWLLSTGTLNGGLLRGNLTELADGQAFFGPFVEPQKALTHGRILIQFHDRAHATLWLLGDAEGRFQIQPISLVRFAFGHHPLPAGRWLVVPEAGGEALALDLSVVESDASQMLLSDASDAATLTCRRLPAAGAALAQQCTLRGENVIDFDDMGLNRWRGIDRSGRPYVAIRLD